MSAHTYARDLGTAVTEAITKARLTGERQRVEVCPLHFRGWPLHFRVSKTDAPAPQLRTEPPC